MDGATAIRLDLLETEASFSDSMSTGKIDPAKWKILGLPTPTGQVWEYKEPAARIEAQDGGLVLTVDPFTRKHDKVHMFDDPKHMYGSTGTFRLNPDGPTAFEAEMGAETYRSNADDLRDGFAAFNVMDFSTGMIFDFISTGRKIGVIYERLIIPGLTDEKTAFTYIIESPFADITTAPRRIHHYTIRIDASRKRAEWEVDGKPFFKTENIPVQLGEITLGFGLFTLKPIDPVKGSVSVHGQGATGIWKNIRYRHQ